MRIMLDNMVYDRIAEAPGMIARLNRMTAEGRITILTTFVQETQMAAIPDVRKRAQFRAIQRTKVPPAAGLYGVTPYGEFPYGSDGSEGGLSVHELMTAREQHAHGALPPAEEHGGYLDLRKGHKGDALIASTASAEADVLITEDGRLLRKLRKSRVRCEVWRFHRFREFVFDESGG